MFELVREMRNFLNYCVGACGVIAFAFKFEIRLFFCNRATRNCIAKTAAIFMLAIRDRDVRLPGAPLRTGQNLFTALTFLTID